MLGGAIALLALSGNPANMALCTACFIRDMAGSFHLHTAATTQYFRPEIVGIVVGAMVAATAAKEFNPTGGSSPVIRFLLGNIMMIGALIFLGCTLRMVLRMASGDISAYIGFGGFILGTIVGTEFLKKGFTLGEAKPVKKIDGTVFPVLLAVLFVIVLVFPALFAFSQEGPGSFRANIWVALGVGLVFGALAYFTRLCMVGAVRNSYLTKNFKGFIVFVGIFAVMLIYNIITGNFAIQAFGPIAHSQNIWNVISMFVVGFAACLGGGCPVRQVVKAGAGSIDAVITVLGMFSGAAFAHNFELAASPSALATAEEVAVAGGPGINGQIVIIAFILVLLIIGFRGIRQEKKQTISAR